NAVVVMDILAQNAHRLEVSRLKTNYERDQEIIALLRKKQLISLAYKDPTKRLEYMYQSIHNDETLTKEEKRAVWGACKKMVPETLSFVVECSQKDQSSFAGQYVDAVQNIVLPLFIMTNTLYKMAFSFYP
ncbi:14879_t:CDS:1, partial [Acaulospora morrowiae]